MAGVIGLFPSTRTAPGARVRAPAADRRIAALTVAIVGSPGSFTKGVARRSGRTRFCLIREQDRQGWLVRSTFGRTDRDLDREGRRPLVRAAPRSAAR